MKINSGIVSRSLGDLLHVLARSDVATKLKAVTLAVYVRMCDHMPQSGACYLAPTTWTLELPFLSHLELCSINKIPTLLKLYGSLAQNK